MADKTTGELDPVRESPIGGLPGIADLYDDTLIPVEQQGEAMHMTGQLFREYAEASASEQANRSRDEADRAKQQADRAKSEADRAQELRDSIELDYDYIEEARKEAQENAASAKDSAAEAAESEANAKESETKAKASEESAASDAKIAKDSAESAEENAQYIRENIDKAVESAETAVAASDTAQESAATAVSAAESADTNAKKAQSYAVGGTGTRENEDVDNASYYYEQTKRISQGLAGSLLPMGTITFEQLATVSKQAGYMYNISNSFTTDATFKEGAGHLYPAGTNVYYTADGFWDCLAGAQVVSVNGQTGAVELSIKDIAGDDLADVAFSGKASDLIGLAKVATSGAASDLTGKVASASTADTATNATNAKTATKLGSATVGDLGMPIYLKDGSPVPCTPSSVLSAIGSAARWTSLWKNSNGTSADFSSANVVSSSDCNLFIIVAAVYGADYYSRTASVLYINPNSSSTSGTIGGYALIYAIPATSSSIRAQYREVSWSYKTSDKTISLSIGEGYRLTTSGRDKGNNYLIPLEVIGTKVEEDG